MRVDMDMYKRSKPFAQEWYTNFGKDNPGMSISLLAFMTGCPCIVIAHWIAEVEGYPDWIVKKIDILMKFYGYQEIANLPEGVLK